MLLFNSLFSSKSQPTLDPRSPLFPKAQVDVAKEKIRIRDKKLLELRVLADQSLCAQSFERSKLKMLGFGVR